ncbi:23S rRNA pseudouridine2605 synthase [Rhizobium sp. BK650]|nr:23S rRNA pseudouridine2605 synthase [Rhizobium sp. BK650]
MTEPAGKRVTLPRALSKLGYCSRTQAERLIAEGRVAVGDRVVADPSAWVDLSTAIIKVDGREIAAEARIYLMLNKPRGLVTTRHDPEGRPTVYDCLTDFDVPHLSPIGRLDKASEGLLLFTNDTEFAQALLDPITHVSKSYHVQIDRIVDDDILTAMTSGLRHDGELLRATSVRKLRQGDRNSWIEVELQEGRNRQIRRMLEALDIGCLRLVRVAIGGLELGDLPKGSVRGLTESEVKDLRRKIGNGKATRD